MLRQFVRQILNFGTNSNICSDCIGHTRSGRNGTDGAPGRKLPDRIGHCEIYSSKWRIWTQFCGQIPCDPWARTWQNHFPTSKERWTSCRIIGIINTSDELVIFVNHFIDSAGTSANYNIPIASFDQSLLSSSGSIQYVHNSPSSLSNSDEQIGKDEFQVNITVQRWRRRRTAQDERDGTEGDFFIQLGPFSVPVQILPGGIPVWLLNISYDVKNHPTILIF